MKRIVFSMLNPVDVNVYRLYLDDVITLDDVDFYRRCVERGLRRDF